MLRSRSVPRESPLARKCSRTRVEKNRSRDSSKQMPVRSSISMRISLNSCSLSPWPGPWRSLIVLPFIGCALACRSKPGKSGRLTNRARWDGPIRFFFGTSGGLGGAELRQRLVQLIRKLYELADGRHCSACSLRSLSRNVGNDLHRVRDTFRSAHLLFRG